MAQRQHRREFDLAFREFGDQAGGVHHRRPVLGKAAGSGDYTGDGRADILWHNESTGANSIWPSANQALKQVLTTQPDLAWKIAGSGDYNGDGKSDILWRNATTGANSIWLSANSATKQAVATVSDTTWQVAGSGDYTGDGTPTSCGATASPVRIRRGRRPTRR